MDVSVSEEVMGVRAKFKLCGGEALEPPAMGGGAAAWAVQSEPRVEPWLGVEPRFDGLAWLSCGSHSIERKVGKCLKLD
ncbi:hypothetical protein CDL15_Pgr002692 [Punica granatum]|uniref:Uncharacterized protein n=1 Tax=Punica granatum TaxID=22663 RepID=A0A218Y1R2_PUNGR|nr:hypothetical protein CDL15_Pgr002692 [Punica granatum]